MNIKNWAKRPVLRQLTPVKAGRSEIKLFHCPMLGHQTNKQAKDNSTNQTRIVLKQRNE